MPGSLELREAYGGDTWSESLSPTLRVVSRRARTAVGGVAVPGSVTSGLVEQPRAPEYRYPDDLDQIVHNMD
jgi:hypothetical protein